MPPINFSTIFGGVSPFFGVVSERPSGGIDPFLIGHPAINKIVDVHGRLVDGYCRLDQEQRVAARKYDGIDYGID